ncbi:DJ-1/PfpI family protein [Singulisphaera sp. PoT]|uniref:DJ-1/PfpI family protein n=1 Tax=Singulisphaera sp. PoT TaxID=3411797 RepID=UPI003BF46D6D
MTSINRLAASLAIVLAFGQPGQAADEKAAKPNSPVALKGLDPISLAEGRQEKGNADLATAHGRFRYLFTTAEHKNLFEKAPDLHALQRDGMCTAMPNVPASPDIFLVHDGKIYGFGSPSCRARFKADPQAFLKPRKNVAILIYEGVELLDFAGPGEVLSRAGQGQAFNLYTVAASSSPITSQGFVAITPRYTLADCPKPDIIVVPGGATRIPESDPAVTDWLVAKSRDAEITLSVCTGAFLLARAGLLDDLDATTHHESLERLKDAAPRARVLEGRRYVDNGKVVTAAGISAGIDATFHVVARLLGQQAASDVAGTMEYRWEPEPRPKSE